jgi:predicted ATP-dependent endonuclease of OLD family
MVKIDHIEISGYKNISSANLNLGNFNVIIGPNNSGKSNFIQTIPFLNFVINSSLDDVEKSFSSASYLMPFNNIIPSVNNEEYLKTFDKSRSGIMKFILVFSNTVTNRVFNYNLEIDWEIQEFKSKFKIKSEKLDVKDINKPGKASTIFSREYNNVNYGSDILSKNVIKDVPVYSSVIRVLKIFREVSEEYKDALDSLDEILKTPIFYFSHIELLRPDKERLNAFNGRVVAFELEKEIISLEESDKWNIFKEALKNILQIEDIRVFVFDGKEKNMVTKFLYFTHYQTSKTLSDFSDGTILIIALITKILSSKTNLFLIEEPENSIHPKALVDLISFIKSFSENVQFIITSHSIALINKTKIEEIIASSVDVEGSCMFYNVSSRKELKNRLKRSLVNFSDELFFSADDNTEFE